MTGGDDPDDELLARVFLTRVVEPGDEAAGRWVREFGAEQARTVTQPVLSVLGSDTEPLWVEVAGLLRSWFPQVEELTVHGVGHLLHMQSPPAVARGVAAFLRRHAMVGSVMS